MQHLTTYEGFELTLGVSIGGGGRGACVECLRGIDSPGSWNFRFRGRTFAQDILSLLSLPEVGLS